MKVADALASIAILANESSELGEEIAREFGCGTAEECVAMLCRHHLRPHPYRRMEVRLVLPESGMDGLVFDIEVDEGMFRYRAVPTFAIGETTIRIERPDGRFHYDEHVWTILLEGLSAPFRRDSARAEPAVS